MYGELIVLVEDVTDDMDGLLDSDERIVESPGPA